MIQPLRRYHRCTFFALAVLLPALFVAGLAARRKTPPPKFEAMLLAVSSGGGKKFKYPIMVWSAPPRARLIVTKPFVVPDALVYWSTQIPNENVLRSDAVFLGRLDPAITYQIPASAPGFFVIYSPAQKSVLDYAAFGVRP